VYKNCINTKCKHISTVDELTKLQNEYFKEMMEKCKGLETSNKKKCYKTHKKTSKFQNVLTKWSKCMNTKCSKEKTNLHKSAFKKSVKKQKI